MTEPASAAPDEESAIPSPAPVSRARGIVSLLFKVALLGGIFGWLIYKKSIQAADLSDLLQRWPWALLALSFFVVPQLLISLRYKLLLRALGLSASYRDVFSISMIGALFDLVAPISTGGDFVKAFYLNRAITNEKGERNLSLVLFSVFLDRVVGFFGLFTFGLIVCVLAWPQISEQENLRKMTAVVVVVCVCTLLGFFVLVSEKLESSSLRKRLMGMLPFHKKFEEIYAGFAGLRHHKKILAMMLGLSLLVQLVVCVTIVTLSQDMQFTSVATNAPAPLELVPCLTVLPIGLFLNTFGMAGGFGVGNLAFEQLFKLMLGLNGGARLILSFQILGVIFRLCGIPFLLLYRVKTKK